MIKWMRNYRAEFTIGHFDENRKFVADETVTVQYPVTCLLDIDLGGYQSACKGVFQFYNLPRTIQAKLWLDLYEIGKKYIILKFYAGYGDVMPIIFQGTLMECTSEKPSGSVDWITQMWGYEGGFMYEHSYFNNTFAKGTKPEDIIETILKECPDVKLGYISPTIPALPRNRTFIGQTMDILAREYGGYEVFISKGEFNIIAEDEVLPGDIQVINDSTGLLGSPRRANIFVELDTLFEPGLKIDQAVELLSQNMPRFNQLYKVIKIHHKGIISPVTCGKLLTTVTLALLQKKPKEIKKAIPTTYQGKATSGQWLKPVKGIRISGQFLEKRPTHLHQGLDIACVNGSDVIAPANGIITKAGSYGDYGYFIEINHGQDNTGKIITSRYGHLSKWLVNPQQKVSAGDLIAKSGGIPGQPGAGSSQGAHLHFEIRQGSNAVNPIKYIGTY